MTSLITSYLPTNCESVGILSEFQLSRLGQCIWLLLVKLLTSRRLHGGGLDDVLLTVLGHADHNHRTKHELRADRK